MFRIGLRALRISSCSITSGQDSIKPLSSCSKIVHLDIHGTTASGSISCFGVLKELSFLDTSNTSVEGSLQQLGRSCLHLKHINVENTAVTGMLSELRQLKLLRELRLSHSQVSGLLSDIDHSLFKLRRLTVAGLQIDFDESQRKSFSLSHPLCVLEC